jgi:hypothetical protein
MDRLLSTDVLTSTLFFLSRTDLDSLPLVNYRLHSLLHPHKHSPFRQLRVLESVSLDSYHDYQHNNSSAPLMRSGCWQIVVQRTLADSHPCALAGCKLVGLANECHFYLASWPQLTSLVSSCPHLRARRTDIALPREHLHLDSLTAISQLWDGEVLCLKFLSGASNRLSEAVCERLPSANFFSPPNTCPSSLSIEYWQVPLESVEEVLPLPPRCEEVTIRGTVLEGLVPVEAVLAYLFREGGGRTLRLHAQHPMGEERMAELLEAVSRVILCASPLFSA